MSNHIDEHFDDVLLESIDEAIRSLFSQQVVDALHANLKSKRSVDENVLPANLQVVSMVLEKYFGDGTPTIEKTIAQRLYSKWGLEFRRDQGYQLTDYVENARIRMQSAAPIPESRNANLPLKDDWDRLLVESVKEGIEGVLGKDSAKLAFRFIERDVTFDKLPRHLPTFYATLKRNFGKDCATIESAIAKKLYQKLCFDFTETPNTELSSYVEAAYLKLSRREQQGFINISR